MALGSTLALTIDISRAQAELNNFNRSLNKRLLLETIGDRILYWVNDNIRKAGAETAWKPMAAGTLTQRPQRTSPSHFSSRWVARLRQSFVKVVNGDTVSVGTEDQFAQFQSEGVKPHVIRPREKRFLKFQAGTGAIVYAREVHHPGIPARPLLPSDAVAGDMVAKVVAAFVQKVIAEM